jgi:hypothetical protein
MGFANMACPERSVPSQAQDKSLRSRRVELGEIFYLDGDIRHGRRDSTTDFTDYFRELTTDGTDCRLIYPFNP